MAVGPAARIGAMVSVPERFCTNKGNVHLHAQSALVDLACEHRIGSVHELGRRSIKPIQEAGGSAIAVRPLGVHVA